MCYTFIDLHSWKHHLTLPRPLLPTNGRVGMSSEIDGIGTHTHTHSGINWCTCCRFSISSLSPQRAAFMHGAAD